jgi:DNA-binding NarL/FixJ family response regulator
MTHLYTPAPAICAQVAHANPLIRAGLATFLAACIDITVAATPDERHDIVVTDYQDGMRRVLEAPPGRAGRVLIVTEQDREWRVRTAIASGVHGYVLQHCSQSELEVAVRSVGRGLRYLTPALDRCLAEGMARVNLTGRESDVLRLLARGFCNKLIARELGIGVGTVKTHVKGLFDKLGASARTQAVILATERGLI